MYGLEIFIRPSTLSRLPTVTFFTKLWRTHKLAYDHCSMTQVYLQILQDVYLYKCDLSEYGSVVYWLINCVYPLSLIKHLLRALCSVVCSIRFTLKSPRSTTGMLQSKSQVSRSRLTFSLKLEQLHNTEPLLKEHIIIQWPVSHISG